MFSRYLALRSGRPLSTAGFTLVELLVSISIVVLVLTIVMTRQDSFNSAVLLRSQAYDIALAIREVQQSAVVATPSGGVFLPMGVHFDEAATQRYVFFTDADGDSYYDSAEVSQAIGRLDSRFEIVDVRDGSGAGFTDDSISIVFQRPDFDAIFEDDNDTATRENLTSVEIDIAPKGAGSTGCPIDLRTIEITATGQVTVIEC